MQRFPASLYYRRLVATPCVLVLIAVAFLIAHSNAGAQSATTPAEAASAEKPLPYQVEFRGAQDERVYSTLRDSFNRLTVAERPTTSLAKLNRRIRGHLATLDKILRADGYYDAKLSYQLDGSSSPIKAIIDVNHGPRYTLARYVVEYRDAAVTHSPISTTPQQLGLTLAGPARAQDIVDAGATLLRELGNRGYPLAVIVDRDVVVDHAERNMSVTVRVALGARALFGPLVITGTRSVDQEYIRSFVTWREGAVFVLSELRAVRLRLLETGLFDSVELVGADSVNEQGLLPVILTVTERKHRSVGLELDWSTDIGFGSEVFWEHRNLAGRQEQLTLAVRVEEIKQEFSAAFRKPRFLRESQSLLADGSGGRQNTDAFQGPLVKFFAGLERGLSDTWTVSGGIPLEFSDLEDFYGTREYKLTGFALRAVRDSADDALDPGQGSRVRIEFAPLVGTHGDQISFAQSTVFGSTYHAFADRRVILAGRAKLGSIGGESSEELPAYRRFYAGGGASIRGYAFQSVGPQAPDGTPLGGRSLVELGTELRFKFAPTLGGVVFFEGGNAYDDPTPDFSVDLRWAAGFGARYFTVLGPLRLDFGFPMNRRSIDDPFQFYISVGQAF